MLNQDEIIEMARQAGLDDEVLVPWSFEIQAFAKLVADVATAKERDRIIEVNKPELDKCNAYIKELENKLARGEA